MEKVSNELDNERLNLLSFIWLKRKIILIMCLLAFVSSLTISFFIKPLYRSTAVVFPTASNSVTFSDQRNSKSSAVDFGEEEHAEQLIQILKSAKIKDKIVAEFDLYNHYGIGKNDPHKKYKLNLTYEGLISFSRTKFNSIAIDVLDQDPKIAANIANKIVELIDTVKNEILSERAIPAFKINETNINLLKEDLESTLDELDSLTQLGVVTVEVRKYLAQAYVNAKNEQDRRFLKNQIDVNQKLGERFDALELIRNDKVSRINNFSFSYQQAKADMSSLFTQKFIVEKASVSDKKDSPKKSIIVLLSVLGTLFFMIFLLLIVEKFKEIRKIG